jgi:hypothetical protein
MDIQAHSKLSDVLKAYPELEDKIMGLAPPFRNLKNPVLRRTVGKLATIEKIARIGELDTLHLVNVLRSEVGQEHLTQTGEEEIKREAGDPEWITGSPAHIIDGTAMLSKGEHPLQAVNRTMSEIAAGQCVLLKTNFKPIPLIDEMTKQSYQVHSKPDGGNPDSHLTFIRK